MQDRFKFRIWDKKSKVFIERGTIDICLGVFSTSNLLDSSRFLIEQCTGLKDKNGRLIYEGDIVRAFGFTESYILVCRFRSSSFCLEYADGRPYNFVHSVAPVEVIGNVHENGDLLNED